MRALFSSRYKKCALYIRSSACADVVSGGDRHSDEHSLQRKRAAPKLLSLPPLASATAVTRGQPGTLVRVVSDLLFAFPNNLLLLRRLPEHALPGHLKAGHQESQHFVRAEKELPRVPLYCVCSTTTFSSVTRVPVPGPVTTAPDGRFWGGKKRNCPGHVLPQCAPWHSFEWRGLSGVVRARLS